MVRVVEKHRHKPVDKKQKEVDRIRTRLDQLYRLPFTRARNFEAMRLDRRLELLFITKVLTLPKLKAVPIKEIIVREPKKPTHQFVPRTERKRQRKKTLVEKVRRNSGEFGRANPKRVQRELARKGFPGVKFRRR
ncbi:MAG: hypothetical protein ABIE23_02590 [archaeon]